MKKLLITTCALLAVTSASFAETVTAEVGLVSPIQIGAPTANVDGFRLSILYTENKNMKGFDWNWFIAKNTGSFNGFKLGGLYNQVDKGGNIIQLGGFVNNYDGKTHVTQVFSGINMGENVEGLRLFSAVNYADKMKGTDVGAINFANNMEGLQIGIFNYAANLNGYQIGLINYAKNSSIFPVLPFFNTGK
jgi:hypothetical protein